MTNAARHQRREPWKITQNSEQKLTYQAEITPRLSAPKTKDFLAKKFFKAFSTNFIRFRTLEYLESVTIKTDFTTSEIGQEHFWKTFLAERDPFMIRAKYGGTQLDQSGKILPKTLKLQTEKN